MWARGTFDPVSPAEPSAVRKEPLSTPPSPVLPLVITGNTSKHGNKEFLFTHVRFPKHDCSENYTKRKTLIVSKKISQLFASLIHKKLHIPKPFLVPIASQS